MSFALARARETTTKSGVISAGSTITLLGAVTQHQAFTNVQPGGFCDVCILAASGGIWFDAKCTYDGTSVLTVDTMEDGSSGPGASVTLPAGTHDVFVTFSASRINKLLLAGDVFIDWVISGFIVPSTSASLLGTMTAGAAIIVGQRVELAAQAHTYTASRDTYVDVSNVGVVTYIPVTNGAGAPLVTANSMRMGKVVSGATITSAVTSGKDSIGTVIRNTYNVHLCKLVSTAGQTIPYNTSTALAFGSGSTKADSFGGHSEVTNNSRITVVQDGMYAAVAMCLYGPVSQNATPFLDLYVSGVQSDDARCSRPITTGDYATLTVSADVIMTAGQYLEAKTIHAGASAITQPLIAVGLSARRVG